MLVEDAGTATASSGGDGEIELRAHRLSEDDAKIAALARNDVAGVRFAIRAVQQNKLIRNICPHQGLQRGAERRHVSNCAFDLRICKDDLTGPHAPPNSAFIHGDDQILVSIAKTTSTNAGGETAIVQIFRCTTRKVDWLG
jgi:hypothetical protein